MTDSKNKKGNDDTKENDSTKDNDSTIDNNIKETTTKTKNNNKRQSETVKR